jgi:CubicO group peptidase (beta-lactamase class C family)
MISTITDKVDRLFTQWDKHDSPGCALAIIQNGEIIYKRGYGMANLEYDIPISPSSIFDIGSNSKQFTAMCIVLLARQNLLTLDDELQKYIPEIPQYSHPITLRHLSCHTSGIRDYLNLMDMSGMIGENHYLNDEIITLIARQQSLNFHPGIEQLYSNTGYFLLGEIVKRVSGKSLRLFAQEHIFAPLGMKNTHFHDNFRDIVKNRADAYEPKEDGGFQTALSWLDCCGDGQIYTTVEDLLLWDRNFYHNILGSYGQNLIEEIMTAGKLDNGEIVSGAFGLQIGDRGGLKTVSHGGSWMGYQSQFIRFPDSQFSVICLANLGTFNPTKLAFEVADIYLEQAYTESIPKLIPRAKSIDLPLADLQLRTGVYHNPTTNSIWDLEIKDEKLMAKVAGMYFQLAPIDSNNFQSVDNQIDCDIEFPDDRTQMLVKVNANKDIKIFTCQKMLGSTSQGLADYIGTYYSAELDCSYSLTLSEGKIYLKCKGNIPFALKSIGEDLFFIESDRFEFINQDKINVKKINWTTTSKSECCRYSSIGGV